MSKTETYMKKEPLPTVLEQVEAARREYAMRDPVEERRKRMEVSALTYGALSEEEGEAFEEAVLGARRRMLKSE